MYKTYFRQAVGMLKQNPFISVISILGTALAIMMIMTMIVTDGIQTLRSLPKTSGIAPCTSYLSQNAILRTEKAACMPAADYPMKL